MPESTDIQPFTFPATGQQVRSLMLDGEPVIEGLESHLYVVEFGQYGIKVGVTADPPSRLGEHQRAGRAFGRSATRGWLTPPHVEARANERELIAFCARQADADPRGEYFAVPFEAACAFAAKLPRSRGDRGAHEAEVQARVDVLKQMVVGLPAPRRAIQGVPADSDPTVVRAETTVAIPVPPQFLARWRKPRRRMLVHLALDIRLPGLDGAAVDVKALAAKDGAR